MEEEDEEEEVEEEDEEDEYEEEDDSARTLVSSSVPDMPLWDNYDDRAQPSLSKKLSVKGSQHVTSPKII